MEPTRKKKGSRPVEKCDMQFTAMPHAVMDSAAFMGASHRAKSLVLEAVRQHNGRNNGHLQLADSYLRRRGWKSSDQTNKARREALERGLILCTRLGGLNVGPSLYCLTWLPISDYSGLDIGAADYHKGAWHMLDALPVPGQGATEKREKPPATRSSTAPPRGAAEAPTAPPHGAKTGILGGFTAPPHGNNELLPCTTAEAKGERCVGRAGRSGKKSVPPQLAEVES